MLRSEFQKIRVCDPAAAAYALASIALKSTVAGGSLMPRAFDVLHTRGNIRMQSSFVFYHPLEERWLAVYCGHSKRFQELFCADWRSRLQLLRNKPRSYARGSVLFALSEAGEPFIHEASLSVLATRELNRARIAPLTGDERSVLLRLMHGTHVEAAE